MTNIIQLDPRSKVTHSDPRDKVPYSRIEHIVHRWAYSNSLSCRIRCGKPYAMSGCDMSIFQEDMKKNLVSFCDICWNPNITFETDNN